MLNVLRQKGVAKKVLWIITIVIILSFAIFGSAWRVDHSLNSAGKINGHNVSVLDYQKAYYDTRDAAIMMYGEKFFKYGDRLNLEAQTWDRLIMLDEAKKRGIKISDQEVIDLIASVPFFQTEGKFDRYKYIMIVQDPRGFDRKPSEFEQSMRSQLMIRKLMDQVVSGINLSEADIKKEYVLKNEKLTLSYALYEPLKAAKDITVSDEDLKKYYEANKEIFRKPTTVNVEYAAVNFPDKATEEQKAAVKKQVEALKKDLKSDSDFKSVAATHKIEVKESGAFSQRQPLLTFAWSPELVEKIFTMKQGEYSPAFETPDGWEIIKIKELKESYVPSLEEAKEEVRTAYLTDKGFTLAKEKADAAHKTIMDALKAGKSFKEAAQGADVKIDTTPSFGRGEYIANMGLIAEFQEVALKLNMQNRLSEVITTNEGPAIIYLEAVEGIDEKQFEADKENFTQMVNAQKKSQAAAEFLTQLRLKANLKSTLDKRLRK